MSSFCSPYSALSFSFWPCLPLRHTIFPNEFRVCVTLRPISNRDPRFNTADGHQAPPQSDVAVTASLNWRDAQLRKRCPTPQVRRCDAAGFTGGQNFRFCRPDSSRFSAGLQGSGGRSRSRSRRQRSRQRRRQISWKVGKTLKPLRY